jgi:hypothetical protein
LCRRLASIGQWFRWVDFVHHFVCYGWSISHLLQLTFTINNAAKSSRLADGSNSNRTPQYGCETDAEFICSLLLQLHILEHNSSTINMSRRLTVAHMGGCSSAPRTVRPIVEFFSSRFCAHRVELSSVKALDDTARARLIFSVCGVSSTVRHSKMEAEQMSVL